MALESKLNEMQLVTVVTNSAYQIWLAGLGAFTKAEREGEKFFESLVTEGEKMESHLKNTASKRVEVVKSKTADTWNKLEEVFQKRVARALKSLGVPAKEDLQMLFEQVEELDNSIKELARLKGIRL